MADQSVTQRPESINPAAVKTLRDALLDCEDLLNDMAALNRAACLMCDANFPAEPHEIGAVLVRLAESISKMKTVHSAMRATLGGAENEKKSKRAVAKAA